MTIDHVLVCIGILSGIFVVVFSVDEYFKQKMHDETAEFLAEFEKREYIPFDLNITEEKFAKTIEEAKKLHEESMENDEKNYRFGPNPDYKDKK